MKKRFWAMLILLLEIRVAVGNGILDLLPDFAGCILLFGMAPGLERTNRKWLCLLGLCSAALWIPDLLKLTAQWELVVWFLGLTVTILRILTVRKLLPVTAAGPTANNLWPYWAVTEILCRLCGWIPVVGTVTTAAALIMGICLLAACFRKEPT